MQIRHKNGSRAHARPRNRGSYEPAVAATLEPKWLRLVGGTNEGEGDIAWRQRGHGDERRLQRRVQRRQLRGLGLTSRRGSQSSALHGHCTATASMSLVSASAMVCALALPRYLASVWTCRTRSRLVRWGGRVGNAPLFRGIGPCARPRPKKSNIARGGRGQNLSVYVCVCVDGCPARWS